LDSTNKDDVINYSTTSLTEQQQKALDGWVAFYAKNYPLVGTLDE